jgi:hypothetical protein
MLPAIEILAGSAVHLHQFLDSFLTLLGAALASADTFAARLRFGRFIGMKRTPFSCAPSRRSASPRTGARPTPTRRRLPAETWRAMEDAADEALVGLLGISNVAVDQLKALLCGARIRPTFVQNRCLVRASWDHEMHTLCQKENIIYQAFSLLSGNRQALLKSWTQIAHHYNKTVPQ